MAAPTLRSFLLQVFALLLPCFALWYLCSAYLALPVVAVAHEILTSWFPQVVHGLLLQGDTTLLATEFGQGAGRPVPLSQADYRLSMAVNTQILSYSLPFYSALLFATQRQSYLTTWLLGVIALYVCMLLGVLSVCLKHLMVTIPDAFYGQTGIWVPSFNLIGISYQISVLLVPTLAPVALWLWQCQDSALLRPLLTQALKAQ